MLVTLILRYARNFMAHRIINKTLTVGFARLDPQLTGESDPMVSAEHLRELIEGWCATRSLDFPPIVEGWPIRGESSPIDISFKTMLGYLQPGAFVIVPSLAHLSTNPDSLLECLRAISQAESRIVSVEDSIGPSSAADVHACLAALLRLPTSGKPPASIAMASTPEKKNGYRGGKRPFGFRLIKGAQGVDLVPDPAESAVIERVRSLRKIGRSLREIAQVLYDEGVTRPSGGAFFPTQIARMLRTKHPSGA